MARSLRNLGGRVIPGRFRFSEPDETQTYATLKALVDAVLDYRRANGIEVESREAVQAEIEDWICQHIGSVEYYCLEDGRPMPQPDHTGKAFTTGYQGQKKWQELHEWALTLTDEMTPDARLAWLSAFTTSLPCGECRRSWRKLARESPAPVDGSAEDMWKWTFERHQDIRRKLRQPLISEEEARPKYETEPSPETEGTQ